MNIVIVNNTIIPVKLYGGTERVIWSLGKELTKLGHSVTYLVKQGSYCDFAAILPIDDRKKIVDQIPDTADIVHFNFMPEYIHELRKPYVITFHGNINQYGSFDLNTIFISKNHAERYGSTCFVHNGLDWDEYSQPDFVQKRRFFHFLGDAAWRVKNVKGAIESIKQTPSETLAVLGGVRFNFNMGIRFTFSPRAKFYGMVGGKEKDGLLNQSKGLIFPIRWHEPFGLAIIESLYFGCPVFGTSYGSLPEIVKKEFGYLSTKMSDIVNAVNMADEYNSRHCHEYALTEFNSKKMTLSYLEKYEKTLSGQTLNNTAPELKTIQTEKFLDWIVV